MGISKYTAGCFQPKYIDYIYSLRCPLTYDIFYVGKTSSLSNRLSGHIIEAKAQGIILSNKSLIIKEILDAGKVPIIRCIDQVEIRVPIDKMFSAYKEVYWIQFYNQIGWNLTNKASIKCDLNDTDYSLYKSKVKNRNAIPSDYYYMGIDENQNHIYDLVRLKSDGMDFCENKDEKNIVAEYNPFENSRWIKMMYGRDDFNYDFKAYKDTDSRYYGDDY